MSDSLPTGDENRPDTAPNLADVDGAVETYTTDEGVVFYDPQNPLGWVETDVTVSLAERV